MKAYVVHVGEADLDTGDQWQRAWMVSEEVAAAIAESLGQPFREYVASEQQGEAIGQAMTDVGIAALEN